MKKILLILMFILLLQGCNSNTNTTTTTTLSTTDSGYITEEYLTLNLYHNVNVNHDPFIVIDSIVNLYEFKVENNEIALSNLSFSNNKIFINHIYLNSLTPGNYNLRVLTTLGYINISLELVNDFKPYIIGSNNINYQENQDVEVIIETFGKGISSISTTGGIETNQYSFSNRTLTINHEFFDEKIAENPDRTNVIFMIAITYNESDTLITAINVILND